MPNKENLSGASDAAFREISPETLISAASGTRRAAVLAGVADAGQSYAEWT